MRDARDELTRLQSRTAARWTWGHQHTLTLENPTFGQSDSGLIDRLLNRGEWEVAGGIGRRGRRRLRPGGGLRGDQVLGAADGGVLGGPGRLDLGDLPGGASGHAFSGHYTDQAESWARGEDRPWPSTPEAVQDATEETLVLEPAE